MAELSLQDPWVEVAEIIRLIRTGVAQTRPEIGDATRLGRNVVTPRLLTAQQLGLVRPSGSFRSRGGRAADIWEFTGGDGRLMVVIVGESGFRVALATMTAEVLQVRRVDWPLTTDPEDSCERITLELNALLEEFGSPALWGLGVGMVAPVDYTTGRNRDPVAAGALGERWPTSFDIRQWFIRRLGVPVWVDSTSNLTVLGAAAAPDAPPNLIAVRLSRGVGSGLIADGNLHRGSDWLSGEITHVLVSDDPERVCLCGRAGCLDAFAGAWAIEADARRLIEQGRSPRLAQLDPSRVTVEDVVSAAEGGDVACVELVTRVADALGRALATIVTWFNPRRVQVTGNALATSPTFMNALRRVLYARALSASVEHLDLRPGDPERMEDVRGGVALVRDALLSPACLAEWGPFGTPPAADALVTSDVQL